MVLRPKAKSVPSGGVLDVWDAVLPTQQQDCRDGWLIAQPDHAALAGNIAEHLSPSLFPGIDVAVVRGIALHDEGWADFDAQAIAGSRTTRSFVDESPETFVQAWTASIERASNAAPVAGMIVSKHFWRLASFREKQDKDTLDDRGRVAAFTAAEESRQQQLANDCRNRDVEFLTDVLQFCDVLSLYLCCGAGQDVEFPQDLRGSKVRLTRAQTDDDAEICRFTPAIFRSGFDAAVAARRATPDRASRQFIFLVE